MCEINAELIINDSVAKSLKKKYKDNKRAFYIAYVEICYEMNVNIPFWTSEAEKQFKNNKEVVFVIDNNTKLVIKAS